MAEIGKTSITRQYDKDITNNSVEHKQYVFASSGRHQTRPPPPVFHFDAEASLNASP